MLFTHVVTKNIFLGEDKSICACMYKFMNEGSWVSNDAYKSNSITNSVASGLLMK
jgi:hypothetical protein